MQRNISLTIELQTITCPGVWLCPNGPLEVTVNCLGFNNITQKLKPKFPISIHKTFKMDGIFYAASIEDLHNKIAKERVEIALWQCGERLAHYVGTLPSLLARNNSAMVQLLMGCTRSLSGAIAPMLQVVAKIENVEYCCGCQSTVISPMVLRDRTLRETVDHFHKIRKPRKLRQDPVCHAIDPPLMSTRSENSRVFQRKSPRDSTYRGNVYCRDCIETLTPTRMRGSPKWDSRSNTNEKQICRCTPINCNYTISSLPEIHATNCPICLKYRQTFNIEQY